MKSQSINKRACKPIIWLLVAMSLLFVPASALAENAISLKLETASVLPGSEVQVPIIIEKNTGLSSLKFSIKYDDTVLTLTNVVFPKNTGTYSCVPEPYGSNQIINFVSPLAAFTKTGTLATLTFSVNQNAELNAVSNILIEYEEDDIFDSNFNTVPFVTVDGGIYVTDGSQQSMAVLPSALSMIEEEAFINTSFYYVVLPETTTSIGSKAFANCSNLKYIYIPSKTTSIADDAFLNVTGLTIYGKSGSYAQTFANRKGYTFQVQ